MAEFPNSEAGIAALAGDVIGGITNDPDLLEGSPVSVGQLEAALAEYRDARRVATEDAARAVLSTQAKNTTLKALAQLVKRILRYAESEYRHDQAKLLRLGWGPPKQPDRLEEPGQALSFRILKEEENSITLAWRKPPEGGKVAAYRIERQRWGEDECSVVGTAVKKRITLEHQEEGIAWTYRVIAVNKAGEGKPSNTVKAVL